MLLIGLSVEFEMSELDGNEMEKKIVIKRDPKRGEEFSREKEEKTKKNRSVRENQLNQLSLL